MNDPKLDLLIKEKMQKYVPHRSSQVMHCGVIVLVSIAIGIFNLTSGQAPAGASPAAAQPVFGAGLGVYLAIAGLAIYFIWTYFRTAKAKKEANAEFLAASLEKQQ